jgi:predicted small secreted protein
MSTRARIGVAGLAVVVIVAAFVIANGTSDSDKSSKTVTVTQTGPTGGTTVETTAAPTNPVQTIVVRNGKPDGGVKTISFAKGDQVEFKVDSDTADEIHVHGYNLMKDVAAGGSISFSFKATIEGIFTIELENAGVQIASLEVTP